MRLAARTSRAARRRRADEDQQPLRDRPGRRRSRAPNGRRASRRRPARPPCAGRARAGRSGCPCGRSCRARAAPARGRRPCPPGGAAAGRRAAGRRARSRRRARERASGTVSRTVTPVICATTSFRLSMCCTLSALYTSMPAVQQLLDVLPALGVPRAGGVGVRELVDQQQLPGWRASARVEVELRDVRAAMLERPCAARTSRSRISASVSTPAVGLDVAHHHVDSAGAQLVGAEQHGVGLAHAGRRAEIDLQMTASGLRLVGLQAPAASRDPAARWSFDPIRVSVDGELLVERQVDQQHVHPGLAEESEVAALDVLIDQPLDRVGAGAAGGRRRAAPGSTPRPG